VRQLGAAFTLYSARPFDPPTLGSRWAAIASNRPSPFRSHISEKPRVNLPDRPSKTSTRTTDTPLSTELAQVMVRMKVTQTHPLFVGQRTEMGMGLWLKILGLPRKAIKKLL
jgi:hypothetical protein